MSESSPWDEIAVPCVDFNVRQVALDTAVGCFWGRDANGDCLFIVELQGDHTAYFRRSVISVNGVNVDLRVGGKSYQRLVLTLEKEVDRDLFESLCITMAAELKHASDSAASLAIALTHIRRWKSFLAGRSKQLLSKDQMRGLYAELTFLLELIDDLQSTAVAIDAWLGPAGSHQDFFFGNSAIEVKSLSGSERSAVRISSEDQLESLNDYLFLRIYRISTVPEAPRARSLNAIVNEVQSRIIGPEVIEEFDRKLALCGYAPLPEYDEPLFVISDIRSYRVAGDFPRVVRSQLPVGVAKLEYEIRLEAIARYECEGSKLFRSI